MFQNNKQHLKVMSYNCRSIRNKYTEVISLMQQNDTDIALIQETWLRDSDGFIIQSIEEYGYKVKAYRKPRDTELGGGVAIITRDSIKTYKIKGLSYRSFEYQSYELKLFSGNVRLINVYRSPYSQRNKQTMKAFLKEFEKFLMRQTNTCVPVIIVGDFNIHFEVLNDITRSKEKVYVDALKFKSLLKRFNLLQHITDPTHNLGGTIDFIISCPNSVPQTENVSVMKYESLSDHYPILFEISKSVQLLKKKKVMYSRRNWSSVNIDDLKNELSNYFNATDSCYILNKQQVSIVML